MNSMGRSDMGRNDMKRAFASREQKKRHIRFVRMQRSSILLMATLLSFVAVCLLIADQLFRPDLFSIDELKIRGTFKYLEPQQVERVVKDKAQGNFFAINLEEIKREVEQLQWVQAVDIRRKWPDALLVDVIEHKPVMRWGKDKWVSSKGSVVDLGEGDFAQQPIILNGDPKDALLIMKQVQLWAQMLGSLGINVTEAYLSTTHAWTLKLSKTNIEQQQTEYQGTIHQGIKHQKIRSQETIELLLGRQNIEQRFGRFIEIYKNNFQFMDIGLKKVDARYPNGLAVTQIKESSSNSKLHDKRS